MVTRPGSSTDLVVAPGADVGRIQLRFDGAASERVDDNGDLVMRLADAEVRQFRPVVYQEWDNGRHLLSARYVLDAAGHVGFEITGGRADKTLIIDPVLAYSSFLGGSGIDVGHAVAVDGNDNLYVTGATYSTDFPTVNPQQPFNAGGADAFVTKLDPTGTVELFSSYLGGSGQENDYNTRVESSGVAVDSAGNVYLAGRTNSIDFPMSHALFGSYRGGDEDGFVAKLSADGSTLLYSTYLGGEDNDSAHGIAVDSAGNMYITGGTRSVSDFPISPGAFQPSSGGGTDAYIVKIDPTQTGVASFVYGSYLGGGGMDRGRAVVVDSSGNAYVTGSTDSADFPTVNSVQPVNAGAGDAFVAVVNPSATGLVYIDVSRRQRFRRWTQHRRRRRRQRVRDRRNSLSGFSGDDQRIPAGQRRRLRCVCRAARSDGQRVGVWHLPGWQWTRRWNWRRGQCGRQAVRDRTNVLGQFPAPQSVPGESGRRHRCLRGRAESHAAGHGVFAVLQFSRRNGRRPGSRHRPQLHRRCVGRWTDRLRGELSDGECGPGVVRRRLVRRVRRASFQRS